MPFEVKPLNPENYRQVLDPLLAPGDFLLNVSVNVSSCALIEFCHARSALSRYLWSNLGRVDMRMLIDRFLKDLTTGYEKKH
ncbi:MAG: saccharopine dehydrogenase NADP-binding domain-containing protein [Nitrosomonas sp.]|nr:saccharopine dehydrogenase NADP-binding domain-containing protein [Nitrosomonas sp.]